MFDCKKFMQLCNCNWIERINGICKSLKKKKKIHTLKVDLSNFFFTLSDLVVYSTLSHSWWNFSPLLNYLHSKILEIQCLNQLRIKYTAKSNVLIMVMHRKERTISECWRDIHKGKWSRNVTNNWLLILVYCFCSSNPSSSLCPPPPPRKMNILLGCFHTNIYCRSAIDSILQIFQRQFWPLPSLVQLFMNRI